MSFLKNVRTIMSERSKTKKKKKMIRGLKAEGAIMRGGGDTSSSMFGRRSTLAGSSQAKLTSGSGKRKKATESWR